MTIARPEAAAGSRGRERRYLLDREGVLGSLLLLPSVAYLLALVAFPLVMAVLYAFTDITTGRPVLHFVGLETFRAALRDPVTRISLRNTIVFTVVSQLLVVILSTVLAFALRADFRGKWFARFLILLPWTTPIALGTIAWLWMLDSIFSPIDWVLAHLGLTQLGSHMYWLGKPHLAIASVIAVQTWRMLPLATVILLAGMSSIPDEIREAAEIDGARFWRRLVEIDVPLLLSLGQGAAVAVFMFPVLAGLAALVLRIVHRAEVS